MKTCTKCELSYAEGTKFCKKCGSLLVSSSNLNYINTDQNTESKNKIGLTKNIVPNKKFKIFALSSISFLLVVIAILLICYFVEKRSIDSMLKNVNDCLIITNENFNKKVEGTYAQLEKQLLMNKAKVLPTYEKAMQAKKITQELVDYIEKLKIEFDSKKKIYSFLETRSGGKENASLLKEKIELYKSAILNLIEPKYRNIVNLGLYTDESFKDKNGKERNWEMQKFYQINNITFIITLNGLIGEIKNAEFNVINQLLADVSIEDFKFNNIDARVISKKNYLLTGDTYEADIFVAAYDTKQKPEIIVGSGVDLNSLAISGEQMKVESVGGIGKLKLPTNGPGLKQFGGVIKIIGVDGTLKAYPFNSEYFVGTPSAIISPSKMNVFYIGVDNPVSISVPSASNEQVTATISGGGGSITKVAGNGTYNVKVTNKGECTINVNAKMGNASRSMGSMKFRIKSIPDPVAYVAGVKGGLVNKSTLLNSGGVIPKMDGFDFNLYPTIVSFTLTMNKSGDLISEFTTGSRFTPKMIQMLNSVSKGQKVFFEDIKAKMPDGIRNLGAIALKIN